VRHAVRPGAGRVGGAIGQRVRRTAAIACALDAAVFGRRMALIGRVDPTRWVSIRDGAADCGDVGTRALRQPGPTRSPVDAVVRRRTVVPEGASRAGRVTGTQNGCRVRVRLRLAPGGRLRGFTLGRPLACRPSAVRALPP